MEIADFPVISEVYTFLVSTMSTPYFEINRDVLYCESRTDPMRLAVVSTLAFVCPD